MGDDRAVTRFLEQQQNISIDQDDDTLMIEFLEHRPLSPMFLLEEMDENDIDQTPDTLDFTDDEDNDSEYEYYEENALMSNDQDIEKNARKKGKKKHKKDKNGKSK